MAYNEWPGANHGPDRQQQQQGNGYYQQGGQPGGYDGYQQPPLQWGQQPPPQQYNQGGPYGYQPGYGPQHPHNPPPNSPPQNLDQYGYPRARAARPPAGQQQFAQGIDYTFQYSDCSGKRKALLIGINYTGQKNPLHGCINDALNLRDYLIKEHRYRLEDMVMLTDDQSDPNFQPTKANILRAMNWLVTGAEPNDALFLHYSGHGGQTADKDGDEGDGHDEVIYPVDWEQTHQFIVDDQIHDVVVKPLKAGVRLTAIFDSCHSGSVMDLPYLYSTQGVLKTPNLAAEAGQGLLQVFSDLAKGGTDKAMESFGSTFMSLAKSALTGNKAYEQTKRTKTSAADVVMWSGSKDDQTSADTKVNSKATGAMSHAFIEALRRDPQQSYTEMLNSIREILKASNLSQKPQLSCSHPLDVDLLFVM